jgi:hypothetical protein
VNVDRQRLERRDVEGVKAARLQAPARGPFGKLDQGRQKSGERLAGAGRRDEERRASGVRLVEEGQLMLARRPAPIRKPLRKWFRQEGFLGLQKGHRQGASFPAAAAQGWGVRVIKPSILSLPGLTGQSSNPLLC